jgi:hypothetical protein
MDAEAHFGPRWQSEVMTALFHSGVILRCIERQMIANAREAEQRKSGVALRFSPHSKNAALSAVATDSRLSRVTARRLYHLGFLKLNPSHRQKAPGRRRCARTELFHPSGKLSCELNQVALPSRVQCKPDRV